MDFPNPFMQQGERLDQGDDVLAGLNAAHIENIGPRCSQLLPDSNRIRTRPGCFELFRYRLIGYMDGFSPKPVKQLDVAS